MWAQPTSSPPVHTPAHWHPQTSKETIIATSPERTRTAICLSVLVRSSAPQTQACQYFTLLWPSLPHNTTARAAASRGVRSWIKNDWIIPELYLICIKLSSAKYLFSFTHEGNTGTWTLGAEGIWIMDISDISDLRYLIWKSNSLHCRAHHFRRF